MAGTAKKVMQKEDGSYVLLVYATFSSLNSDYFVSGVRFKPKKEASTRVGPDASIWSS